MTAVPTAGEDSVSRPFFLYGGLLQQSVAHTAANACQKLLSFLHRNTKNHCNLSRFEPLHEIKFESLALGLWPTVRRVLHLFQEFPSLDHLVRWDRVPVTCFRKA